MITTALKTIPVAERLRLIGELWDSLNNDSDSLPVTSDQKTELDRIINAYEHDGDRGRFVDEVFADLRKTL